MKGIIMTKYHFLLLSLTIFSASQLCNADDMLSNNRITVFGKAEVSAPADRAKISFTVTGYGPTLRSAVDKAKKKIADISSKIVKTGLKKKNLNTSHFYTGENPGSRAFLSNKKDYRARITMYVSVDDLSLLESVIFLLSESEVDDISNVYFSLKDNGSFKQKARQLAVQKAKRKAEEFAKELNIVVGRATVVEEIPQTGLQREPYIGHQQLGSNVSYQQFLQSEFAARESTGYFIDTIQVYSAVKVVFKIKE
jgi:uncharacterized protein YggE